MCKVERALWWNSRMVMDFPGFTVTAEGLSIWKSCSIDLSFLFTVQYCWLQNADNSNEKQSSNLQKIIQRASSKATISYWKKSDDDNIKDNKIEERKKKKFQLKQDRKSATIIRKHNTIWTEMKTLYKILMPH